MISCCMRPDESKPRIGLARRAARCAWLAGLLLPIGAYAAPPPQALSVELRIIEAAAAAPSRGGDFQVGTQRSSVQGPELMQLWLGLR